MVPASHLNEPSLAVGNGAVAEALANPLTLGVVAARSTAEIAVLPVDNQAGGAVAAEHAVPPSAV